MSNCPSSLLPCFAPPVDPPLGSSTNYVYDDANRLTDILWTPSWSFITPSTPPEPP